MATGTTSYKTTGWQDLFSIGLLGLLFFTFGFVSWVNAILIPYFKIACELTNFQSYLVAFAFYIAYLLMSMPSAYLLKVVGYKRGMVIGFWIMAAGALLFVPAAYARTYPIFLLGLFTLGTGLAILQTVANLYVTVVGRPERAAQRISIMGICNKGAGILAPLVFSWAVFRANDETLFSQLPLMDAQARTMVLDQLIIRVVKPYSILATLLFAIGLLVRFSPLPEITGHTTQGTLQQSNIWQFPHLVLGALAIFLHVGTQVIAIDTVINYASTMGLSLLQAKALPSYTLTATIIGYLLGIVLIPRFLSQQTMFRLCASLGLLLALLVCLTDVPVRLLQLDLNLSIWFLMAIGLPNALIWAGIWPLALHGLGDHAKQGAALLIMGLCGNAVLPMLYGWLADLGDEQQAYWLLVPCFLYLVFYAFWGHTIKKWTRF